MPLPSEVHPSQRHKYNQCKNPECSNMTRAEVTGYCRSCLTAQKMQMEEPPYNPPEELLGSLCEPECPVNIVAVDIECTSLNSSFGRILCVGLYNMTGGSGEVVLLEAFKPSDERELLLDLHEHWNDIDILVTYNGMKFDYCFLNGRAAQHGVRPFPRKLHIDLLKYTRKWRLGRASLDMVAQLLNLPVQKVHCSPKIWIDAQAGDRVAFDKLLSHCSNDVLMLAPLLKAVKPQIVSITQGR